jgi:hypothetical protein
MHQVAAALQRSQRMLGHAELKVSFRLKACAVELESRVNWHGVVTCKADHGKATW